MEHPGENNCNIKKMELVINPCVITQIPDLERFADSQITLEDSLREVVRQPPANSPNNPLRRDIFQGKFLNHVGFGVGVINGQRAYAVSRTEYCRNHAMQEENNTCIMKGVPVEKYCPRCTKYLRDIAAQQAQSAERQRARQADDVDAESTMSSNIFASNDVISESPPQPRCVLQLSNSEEEGCAPDSDTNQSDSPRLPECVQVLSDPADHHMISMMQTACQPSSSAQAPSPSPPPPTPSPPPKPKPVLKQTNIGKWLSKAKARAEKESSQKASSTDDPHKTIESATAPSGLRQQESSSTPPGTSAAQSSSVCTPSTSKSATAQLGPSRQESCSESAQKAAADAVARCLEGGWCDASAPSTSKAAYASQRVPSPENFTPAFGGPVPDVWGVGDWDFGYSRTPTPEILDPSPQQSPEVVEVSDEQDEDEDDEDLQTLVDNPAFGPEELEIVYRTAHLTEDKNLLKELIFLFSSSTCQFGETVYDILDWYLMYDASQGNLSYMLVAESSYGGTPVKKMFPNIFVNLKEAFTGGPVHAYFSCRAVFGCSFELKYLGAIPHFPDLSSTTAIGRQQISLSAMARRSVYVASKNCLGHLLARDVKRINPAEFLYEIYFPCLAHMTVSDERLGVDEEERRRFYGQFSTRKDDYIFRLQGHLLHRNKRVAARTRLSGMFPSFIQVPWNHPPIPYLLDELSFGMVRYLNR